MAPRELPANAFVIEVRLKSARELFNSLDPSPLLERDLDTRVEAFITEWAGEAPGDTDLHLVIHLPAGAPRTAEEETLQAAIQAYFRLAEAHKHRQMRKLLGEGRRSALVGIVFLTICITAAQLVRTMTSSAIAATISEGLLIIGWVANWRPVSILLYEWRPIRKEIDILKRLSNLTVEIRKDGPGPQSAEPSVALA